MGLEGRRNSSIKSLKGFDLQRPFTTREHIFDLEALLHGLPTRTVPGYERTCRGVTLGNDVVPDVR
jgi:hypothetical protein